MALYDPQEPVQVASASQITLAARTAEELLANPATLADCADRLSVHADYPPEPIVSVHVERLLRLALYLLELPHDYAGFGMSCFHTGYRNECGAVACAVGHAPRALDLPWPEYNPQYSSIFHENEIWMKWSRENLGPLSEKLWEYCFSGAWDLADNTPQGAAARIVYLLVSSPERMAELADLDEPLDDVRYLTLLEPTLCQCAA